MPLAARVTDPHFCPETNPVAHNGGPVLPPGYPRVEIDGLPAVRVTDLADCTDASLQAIIAAGSPLVFFGDQMAVRVDDPTYHAGRILQATPASTVEIGGPTAVVTVVGGVVTLTLGGMIINGVEADVAEFFGIITREMLTSETFAEAVVEMILDTAHPITFNVGRDNAITDSFNTNAVDLNDLAWFPVDPPPDYPWARTQGETVLHFIVERRYAAVNGSDFNTAHDVPLLAGGAQEQYRQDRGQPGRIVSQTGVDHGTWTDAVIEDGSGNQFIYRVRNEPGWPIFEIEYRPADPAQPGSVITSPP
jgi:uncharacterized Zn-binding protein involved in type VI secretion